MYVIQYVTVSISTMSPYSSVGRALYLWGYPTMQGSRVRFSIWAFLHSVALHPIFCFLHYHKSKDMLLKGCSRITIIYDLMHYCQTLTISDWWVITATSRRIGWMRGWTNWKMVLKASILRLSEYLRHHCILSWFLRQWVVCLWSKDYRSRWGRWAVVIWLECGGGGYKSTYLQANEYHDQEGQYPTRRTHSEPKESMSRRVNTEELKF